jgi:Trk-type K+ transport system membrane component
MHFVMFQTLYLFGVLVLFTCLQWFLEMGLDWTGSYFENVSPIGRVIVALFQAISTRTAGFNAFDLSLSSPSIQVIYVVMMYISSYPVALSARTSTVHKGSLEPEDEEEQVYRTRESAGGKNNVKYQAKNLIFRDVSYLFVALMIITIVEDDRITADPGYSIFKILFELVSAYGTVGLTLGYPGSVLSLSGTFHIISKLVIIVVMLLGRHRGLPLSIDHAVNYTSAIAMDIEADSAKRPVGPTDRSRFVQEATVGSPTVRRVSVDVGELDRRKSRMRSDSF